MRRWRDHEIAHRADVEKNRLGSSGAAPVHSHQRQPAAPFEARLTLRGASPRIPSAAIPTEVDKARSFAPRPFDRFAFSRMKRPSRPDFLRASVTHGEVV